MAKEEVVINITTDTKKASSNVKGLNKDIKQTGTAATAAGTSGSAAFQMFGGSVGRLIPMLTALKAALISTGVGALIVALGGLTSILSKAAKNSVSFGKSQSNLKAILSGSIESTEVLTEDMEALTLQAKKLGASTAFTASEVLELQTNLAKIGFTTDDILNATGATLDFAAALNVDLGDAAAFAGSVVASFGLTTEETQRAVDVLALSTSKSGLDFNSLRESMKNVAPVANSMGYSLEETTALLGILADNGIKGGKAGTGLAATMIKLNQKSINLTDALNDVTEAGKGSNLAFELAGDVGGKALLALAGKGAPAVDGLTGALNAATGASKELAAIQLDNVAGDLTILNSTWEGYLLTLEDGAGFLTTIMRKAIQFLTGYLNVATKSVSFLNFAWTELVSTIDKNSKITIGVAGALFNTLSGYIKQFANQALLEIAKIPIIGEAIDEKKARKNIRKAKDLLKEANQQLADVMETFEDEDTERKGFFARFQESEDGKEREKQLKALELANDQLIEEQKEKDEESVKLEKDRLEKVKKLREKYKKSQEDFDAKTAAEKLDLERKRAIEEINASVATQDEKKKLLEDVNKFYDDKEKALEAEKEEKVQAKLDALEEDEIAKLEAQRDKELQELVNLDAHEDAKAEIKAFYNDKINKIIEASDLEEVERKKKLEADKKKMLSDGLNMAIETAGRESKIGKALFIAKQALALKEVVMNAKKAITNANLNAAESGTEIAKGQSKAASSLPPPFNLIPIAMFAMQAIGIVKSINQSKKQVATVSGGLGGGGASPDVSLPAVGGTGGGAAEMEQPDFDIFGTSGTNQIASALGNQPPVQAFVVSQDVTTAQSLQNNIISGSTLG